MDHNDPQQMVKEVGALAFPAACNVPPEAVGALPCILVQMDGWMDRGWLVYASGGVYSTTLISHLAPPHTADAKASQAMRKRIVGVIDHHALSEAFSTAGGCDR